MKRLKNEKFKMTKIGNDFGAKMRKNENERKNDLF